MKQEDIKIEYTKGTGPGGQNKNKLETACKITHLPTEITAYADERKRRTSYKKALKALKQKVADAKSMEDAARKKAKRDHAIHNTPRIRTYDYKSGTVKDHRTGKVAPLKEVLGKGRIDLLK